MEYKKDYKKPYKAVEKAPAYKPKRGKLAPLMKEEAERSQMSLFTEEDYR